MIDLNPIIEDIADEMARLRRQIHAHPELGFEEHQTRQTILDHLEPIDGLETKTGVAKTGVVSVLNPEKSGRCVALRAEMDALPIQEQSRSNSPSRIPGKMHACGHDGHMACLVGAAKVLARAGHEVPGKVKFIFQPAEEGGGGGQVMCNEGVLEGPTVDAIFAMHGWPYMRLGEAGVSSGPAMASADFFEVTIHGQAAHAAFPHRSTDPIVAASHVVVALQSIAARSTDPLDSVVVTVGMFNAGTALNIIPGAATIKGTIRTLSEAVRQRTLSRFEEIIRNTAAAHGARAEISLGPDTYPVLVNHQDAAALVHRAACREVGEDRAHFAVPPSMGGEDFAFFAQRLPAAFWRLGIAGPDEKKQPTLHQPDFEFPDEAIPLGIRLQCAIALQFLELGFEPGR